MKKRVTRYWDWVHWKYYQFLDWSNRSKYIRDDMLDENNFVIFNMLSRKISCSGFGDFPQESCAIAFAKYNHEKIPNGTVRARKLIVGDRIEIKVGNKEYIKGTVAIPIDKSNSIVKVILDNGETVIFGKNDRVRFADFYFTI